MIQLHIEIKIALNVPPKNKHTEAKATFWKKNNNNKIKSMLISKVSVLIPEHVPPAQQKAF